MDTKEKIISLLNKEKALSGTRLAKSLGISRQAVNRHLQQLLQAGILVKEGVTRGAVYKVKDVTAEKKFLKRTFKKSFLLLNLEEDKVFQQINLELNLAKSVNPGGLEIARYAFTEMLNNAIDHSRSEKCQIEVIIDEFNFTFRIRDFGIGLYFSICDKFNLPDENSAVGELIKGKTTTMRERHSGEGIFFTSKVADTMYFRSHKVKLLFDNQKKDIFIEELRTIRGTEVFFSIKKRTRKKLEDIFSFFAPEEFDYKFEKTRAMVKLFQKQYISRSEAKRLHHGLDKFTVIILDFKGVKALGQGFADELFRVFMQEHPHIILELINLKPSLQPIINHAVDNKTKKRLTIS